MIDKSEKKSYCLISGSFVPEDARLVLMTLINDKISFHERNDWSSRERFGEADTAALKRIEELRQTKANMEQLIEEAAAMGMKLRIDSNIQVVMEPS